MDHTPGQRQWRDLRRFQQFHEGRDGTSEAELRATVRRRQEEQQRYAAEHRLHLLEFLTGRPVTLASHDDTTVEQVEEAAADGMTIAEFPTTSDAAQAARRLGLGIVGGAPNVVLGGSHSGNVSVLALARDRLLDALSSDYVPASLLHAAFGLHDQIDLPLPEALATVTANHARLIGLTDRGALRPGLRADLVRVRHGSGVPNPLTVWRAGRRVA